MRKLGAGKLPKSHGFSPEDTPWLREWSLEGCCQAWPTQGGNRPRAMPTPMQRQCMPRLCRSADAWCARSSCPRWQALPEWGSTPWFVRDAETPTHPGDEGSAIGLLRQAHVAPWRGFQTGCPTGSMRGQTPRSGRTHTRGCSVDAATIPRRAFPTRRAPRVAPFAGRRSWHLCATARARRRGNGRGRRPTVQREARRGSRPPRPPRACGSSTGFAKEGCLRL